MDLTYILEVAHKEAMRQRDGFLVYLIGMALIEAKRKRRPTDRRYERRKA